MTHTLQVAMLQTDAGLFSLHGNQVLQTQLKPLFDQLQRIFKWFYVCSQKCSAVRLWISCSNCLICCFGKKKKVLQTDELRGVDFGPKVWLNGFTKRCWRSGNFISSFLGLQFVLPSFTTGVGGGIRTDRQTELQEPVESPAAAAHTGDRASSSPRLWAQQIPQIWSQSKN